MSVSRQSDRPNRRPTVGPIGRTLVSIETSSVNFTVLPVTEALFLSLFPSHTYIHTYSAISKLNSYLLQR